MKWSWSSSPGTAWVLWPCSPGAAIASVLSLLLRSRACYPGTTWILSLFPGSSLVVGLVSQEHHASWPSPPGTAWVLSRNQPSQELPCFGLVVREQPGVLPLFPVNVNHQDLQATTQSKFWWAFKEWAPVFWKRECSNLPKFAVCLCTCSSQLHSLVCILIALSDI